MLVVNDKKIPPSQTQFDWLIYADATFAGLSVLIPIPMVDLAFEWFFRGRMARAIAKRNGRSFSRPILRELNRKPLSCTGCLFLPVLAVLEFLKRLYRTVLYFLTVKAATDQLSYYWHRAFLLNHMMQQGHLDDEMRANSASLALNDVLKEITTSPLTKLAQQVIAGVRHVFRTLFHWARRRQEDETVTQTRQKMADAWTGFSDHLETVAVNYDEIYERYRVQWVRLERQRRLENEPRATQEREGQSTEAATMEEVTNEDV